MKSFSNVSVVPIGGFSLFWTRDSILLVCNRSKVPCARMSSGSGPKTGQAAFPTILFGIG